MAQSEFVISNLGNFLIGFPGHRPGGLVMSLILTIFGFSVGLILALLVATTRDSRLRAVRAVSVTFVHVVRGVPLILLLLLTHQYLGGRTVFGLGSALTSALVTLVLYSGAYQGDILAAGFRAVPEQLIDDARLLGCGRWRVLVLVKLPHSVRAMRPALAGQIITLFKDSSVVVILGVVDLTTTARLALGSDITNAPHWVATYLTVGAIYFLIALSLSRVAQLWEQRAPSRGSVRGATSAG